MFQDEARFGLIADVRRAWAPKPIRPLCCGMLTHEYTYAYAAVDILTGELDALILPHVNTPCMQVFLDEVAARHPEDRIIRVLDGAGWHASHDLHVPDNIRLLPLPPSPLNSIRLSTSGTSFAKSTSAISPSTAWTPWKTPRNLPSECGKPARPIQIHRPLVLDR